MIGATYYKLTVVAEGVPYLDMRTGQRKIPSYRSTWLCRCECGADVTLVKAKFGKTSKSCRQCSILKGKGSRPFASVKRGPNKRSKPPGYAGLKKLLKVYQYHARKRGYDWTLTEEEFGSITSKSCFYCATEPSQLSAPGGEYKETIEFGTYKYNGIDRFDNSKGYHLDNCVPCCGRCNKFKMAMNGHEFLNLIRMIAKNTKVA